MSQPKTSGLGLSSEPPNLIFCLALLLSTILACWAYSIPGELLRGRDLLSMHIPHSAVIHQSQTYPVLWNPYSHCGTPALANLAYAMLNPIQIFNLWFDPIYIQYFYIGFHVFLFALGAYFFIQSFGFSRKISFFVTSISLFSFNLHSMLEYGHALMIANLSASIWVFLMLRKLLEYKHMDSWIHYLKAPQLLFMCLFISYMFLNGGVQVIHHQYVALFIFILVSQFNILTKIKTIIGITIAHLMAAFLAWPQLGTTLESLMQSSRANSFNSENFVSEGALEISSLIKWISPLAHGNPQYFWGQHDFWFGQAFCGVLLLASLLIACTQIKKSQLLPYLITSLLLIFIAIGDKSPIFHLYTNTVPLSGMFRYVSRYMYPAFFCLLPLMAYGLNIWISQRGKSLPLYGGLILFSSLSIWLLFNGNPILSEMILPSHVYERYKTISMGWTHYETSFFLCELMSLVTAYVIFKVYHKNPIIPLCFILLIFQTYHRYQFTSHGFPFEKIQTHVIKSPIERVVSLNPMAEPNAHVLQGYFSVTGYDTIFPLSYRQLLDTFTPQDWNKKTREQFGGMNNDQFKLLGVDSVISTKDSIYQPPFEKIEPRNDLYYLTQKIAQPFRKESDFYDKIKEQQELIKAQLNQETYQESQNLGVVKIVSHQVEEVILSVKVYERSVLASSENTNQHWTCKVNQSETEILPWLGTFRSIILNPGDYTITFSYDRTHFYKNCVIALFAAIFIFIWFGSNLKRFIFASSNDTSSHL